LFMCQPPNQGIKRMADAPAYAPTRWRSRISSLLGDELILPELRR
jgi:hypothetical protein